MRISDWSSDVCSSDLSTKAAVGDHDENIDFDTMVRGIGAELAEQVRDATLRLYTFAADYALRRGIILADTKFVFGTDADGRLSVMDDIGRAWGREGVC